MAKVFLRYPVPAARRRSLSPNVCFNPTNPSTGRPYSNGRKAGTKTWKPMHAGRDVRPSEAGKIGENVYPVRPGTVVGVGNIWGTPYGKQVLVKHRFAWDGQTITRYSFYAHLDRISVRAGQRVTVETKLGDLGKSGGVTGPHVHFVWQTTPNHKDGVIDPTEHLEAVR